MNVLEMINILRRFPMESKVKTWDCFNDKLCDDVTVSFELEGKEIIVLISDDKIGEDICNLENKR